MSTWSQRRFFNDSIGGCAWVKLVDTTVFRCRHFGVICNHVIIGIGMSFLCCTTEISRLQFTKILHLVVPIVTLLSQQVWIPSCQVRRKITSKLCFKFEFNLSDLIDDIVKKKLLKSQYGK